MKQITLLLAVISLFSCGDETETIASVIVPVPVIVTATPNVTTDSPAQNSPCTHGKSPKCP